MAGVTAEEADEAGPVPTALVAVTVKVYAVPAVRLVVTVQWWPDVVQVPPPELAVTVYAVMAEPPFEPAVHDTAIWGARLADAGHVGGDHRGGGGRGPSPGSRWRWRRRAALVPAALVAVTVKVYGVPAVRPG